MYIYCIYTPYHALGVHTCVYYYACSTGFFYFLLGNCHPKFRSKLKAVQLVAICKHRYIKKYSLNSVLDPVVEDLKKLVRLSCYVHVYTKEVVLFHYRCT